MRAVVLCALCCVLCAVQDYMAALSETPEDCRLYMNISLTHLKMGHVNEVRSMCSTLDVGSHAIAVYFGSRTRRTRRHNNGRIILCHPALLLLHA
jgi:hypothetical protein